MDFVDHGTTPFLLVLILYRKVQADWKRQGVSLVRLGTTVSWSTNRLLTDLQGILERLEFHRLHHRRFSDLC